LGCGSMKRLINWVLIGLLLAPAAKAGPFFEIQALPGSGTAPDVVSAFWGSAATGGGGLTGRITFADGFGLPAGGPISFQASDIEEVTFAHIQLPTSVGTVAPVFSFTASSAQISAASGQVVIDPTFGFRLLNVDIQTSVQGTLFRLPGGIIAGDFLISGLVAGLNDTEIALSPFTGIALLTQLSTSPGAWGYAGTTEPTAISAPSAGLFLAVFALAVFVMRRRLSWRPIS
jgi:hypothetical protein